MGKSKLPSYQVRDGTVSRGFRGTPKPRNNLLEAGLVFQSSFSIDLPRIGLFTDTTFPDFGEYLSCYIYLGK